MPSTPYAQLLVAVAGGTPTSGGQTATAGDTLAFSFASTVGWGNPVARTQIYSFPSGFSCPAGWTATSATINGQTVSVYEYAGNTPPPSFALPAAPWFGKLLFRLIVLGGTSSAFVDEASGVSVESANGIADVAFLEASQFDAVRPGGVAALQALVREVNTLASGGSGVASVSGTAPIVSSGGATPAISISAASGTGPGSMSVTHWTLCDGATDAATVSTLVKRDAAGRFKAVAGVASDDVAVVSQCGGASWRTTPDAHDLGVWTMGETSGSFLNTGAAGTLSLAPTGTVSHLDEGGLGTGVYMQGAGSYVASADTSLCQPTALTVWSWVRVRKFDSLYPIVIAKLHDLTGAGFNDPYFDYAIEIFPSIAAGKWLVAINVGGVYRAVECGDSNRFSVVVDRPHLLALTYDGAALRAYMDGVEAGNLSAAGSITYGNGRIIRGGHPVSATYGIDGWLGEARVVDQAMTAAQLAEVYRRGMGRWP